MSGGQLICKFIAAVVVKIGGVHIKDQSHIQVCPALEAAGGEPLIQVHGTASKNMTATFISDAPQSKFHPYAMGRTASRAFGTFCIRCECVFAERSFFRLYRRFFPAPSRVFRPPLFLPFSFARSFSLCILVGEFLGQKKKRGYLVPIYLRQKCSHSGHPFHAPPLRAVRTPTNKKQASNWVWLPPFLDWTACFEISVRMQILRSFSVTANMVSA